jgi:hypothetical protein
LTSLENRCAPAVLCAAPPKTKWRISWTRCPHPASAEGGVFNDKNAVQGIDCAFVTARSKDCW